MTITANPEIIVIGAGIAGALCAYELAQKGVRVLIVEAGPRVTRDTVIQNAHADGLKHVDSGYPNLAHAERPATGSEYFTQTGADKFQAIYLRLVGGTTWHWQGTVPRLNAEDFRFHSLYGQGIDWPITYDDLKPFYEKAEIALGVSGESVANLHYPLPATTFSFLDHYINRKLQPAGYHFTLQPAARNSRTYDGRSSCMGYGSCTPICPSGARYMALNHIEKAERAGVEVLADALVTSLNVGDDRHIESINIRRPNGAMEIFSAPVVVLAANGIETVRILLASRNERFAQGLANRSDQVGRNLMDHPAISAMMTLPDAVYPGRGPQIITACQRFNGGVERSERGGYVITLVNVAQTSDITASLVERGVSGAALDAQIRDQTSRRIQFDARTEQLPEASNRVSLDWDKKDRAGQPNIRIHYQFGEYARRGLKECAKHFEQFAGLLQADELAISAPRGANHIMGTTRMGENPAQSVVDKSLRCHDHPNLYIASSSVFPTAGTANPTLTIAALSLRLADHIHAALSRQ